MRCGPLPDDDHFARYCSPLRIDSNELPTPAAFELDENEDYLSVNWLEFHGLLDAEVSIECIREEFLSRDYTLRRNGRFVVLNVGEAKSGVYEQTKISLSIDRVPLPNNLSHAGVFWYRIDEFDVAVEPAALVREEDVHLALL